jgi:hypothetical protein
MATQRSPEGQAKVKKLNARIGNTCLLGLLCIGFARLLQEVSTLLAIVRLAIGWCVWIYAMTLVFSKRPID